MDLKEKLRDYADNIDVDDNITISLLGLCDVLEIESDNISCSSKLRKCLKEIARRLEEDEDKPVNNFNYFDKEEDREPNRWWYIEYHFENEHRIFDKERFPSFGEALSYWEEKLRRINDLGFISAQKTQYINLNHVTNIRVVSERELIREGEKA